MNIREVNQLPFESIEEINQEKKDGTVIIGFPKNTNLINSYGNPIRKFIFWVVAFCSFIGIIWNIYNIVKKGILDDNYLILVVIPISILAMGAPNYGSKRRHRAWLFLSFILLILSYFIENQTIKGCLLGFSVSYFLMLIYLSVLAGFNAVISSINLTIFTECWKNGDIWIYNVITKEFITFKK